MAHDVRLRTVIEDDLPILFQHQIDPDAIEMAAFPPRDRDAFMAHWAKIMNDPASTLRAILFDGEVAGYVTSFERSGKREVGYWIGKEYWGRGIATQALAEFLEMFRARPLYAHVAKHNAGSLRVLEKCGFTICGEDKEFATRGDAIIEGLIFKLEGEHAER